MTTTKLYRVHFFTAVDGREDYYFASLPAVYGRFSEDAVGVGLDTLLNSAPKPGKPRITRRCAIYREEMHHS